MARLVRSIPVAWPFLLVLVALAAAAWIQGLRMAADRSERLRPVRVAPLVLDADGTATVSTAARFATVDLGDDPPPRLGLYQILPARPLVRWIEDAGADRPYRQLVVPLEGLPPGTYALCAVDAAATAGPVEMDRPEEELVEVGRFRVVE